MCSAVFELDIYVTRPNKCVPGVPEEMLPHASFHPGVVRRPRGAVAILRAKESTRKLGEPTLLWSVCATF